jgi:hypothetical protein
MDTNKKKEIVISKSKDITLASSKLTKRGLEIISELDPRRKHVPNDYPTIAEALDHAVDGDTIELAEGIYHESLQITKPVAIIGASHSRVILESPDLSPIFSYHVTHGTNKLKNIVIRKASEQDFVLGIDANGEFFEFENCQFEDFSCSADYMGNCDEELWDTFGTMTAVQIGKTVSTAKFLHCNFSDCEIGIKINDRSCIDLSNCNFFNSMSEDSPKSILSNKDCRIKSSLCLFSHGSIHLGSHTYYKSSYDTFLDVEGIIEAGVSCQASFSHATFVSNCLLTIAISEGVDPSDANLSWNHGKPKIHFSNSIVIVKDGYKPNMRCTVTGIWIIVYNGATIMNLANEGILSYSNMNLLNIPPHFLCQDPLLIFENNIARLSPNSPAIKSASDGTNLGAWQGD